MKKLIIPIFLILGLITLLGIVSATEFRGDGSYVVNTGDIITANNDYKIKVYGAYAPYVAWWYSLALISSEGNFLYNFSHGVYDEVPIYSGANKTGDIVLYLKATAPDGGRTLTVRSVDNSVGCISKDHKACMKDDNNSAGNIYWVDSCNNRESTPVETCGKSGCRYSSASCVEEITPKEQPIEIPEKYITNETLKQEEFKCNGCELDTKCYPFGFRKDGNYCSDKDNKFVVEKTSDNSCENNFECQSNVCVSSKCVSEGLIQKILNWFRRLFGGE